jgi:hypothetical protein
MKHLAKVGIESFQGDAHALLVWIYRNTELPIGLRLDAAKAAAPFEKPRLATRRVEVTRPQDMTDDELADHIAAVQALIAGDEEQARRSAPSGVSETRVTDVQSPLPRPLARSCPPISVDPMACRRRC